MNILDALPVLFVIAFASLIIPLAWDGVVVRKMTNIVNTVSGGMFAILLIWACVGGKITIVPFFPMAIFLLFAFSVAMASLFISYQIAVFGWTLATCMGAIFIGMNITRWEFATNPIQQGLATGLILATGILMLMATHQRFNNWR